MQQPPEDARASGAGVPIELQPPPMDRGRSSISRGRGAKKRATLPSHSSLSLQSHPFSDSASPSTPEALALPSAQRLSYTAPQRGGKARHPNNMATPHRASSPAADQALRVNAARTDRPARASTFHAPSFSFESPSAAGSIMAAAALAPKRSRTVEASYDGAADDEGHSKGGHSLRKRARIDYTQEMIDDDLGLPSAKNDLVVKPVPTPSARGRKRKGGHDDSDEELEDFGSKPKRHRIDKSPAATPAPPSRRRYPSKKLSTDLSSYVDQPSDNEVQDTILVSVPTGPAATSEEGSEYSSFLEPESRPPSSDESKAAPIQVQPPTPRVQPSQSIEDVVSVAAEIIAGIDQDTIPEQPDDKPQAAPSRLSPTPDYCVEEPEQSLEHETRKTDLIVPTVVQEPEPASPRGSKAQIAEASPSEQDFSQPPGEALEQASATESPSITPAPELKLPEISAVPPVLHDLAPMPTVSRASSLQEPKLTGPARFKSLERIYNLETPFASQLKLSPYEDEDIPLPGPYTEWVHPAQAASTPVPPPSAAPSSLERKPAEGGWNTRRRLKTSEFFALYRKETKRRQEKGEPAITMTEFNNECARRYKSAHVNDPASATPPSTTKESTTSSTVVVEKSLPFPATAQVEEEALRDSQPAESRLPTAAPSPAPMEDAMVQEDAAEDEQDADETIDDQVQPNSPGGPVEVTRNPHKQYLFRKIRDPNEFVDAFEGWQDFSSERLYETVAATVEALDAYQQEYNELKKLLDDEENAKRRQANDKTVVNWENRQKADEPLPWRRHFDDVVKGPPSFEVRGLRAPKPYIDDPMLEHQKEEDRTMANAYGFKLNTHPTQVGRQNPVEQRWEMPENRLRKRTEKGAELAEDNVVEGKRTRKPRHVSDQSKDPSRAGTPTGITVFGPGRRQRRKPTGAAPNGDELEGPEQAQFTESFSESPRKARAARTRGTMLYDDQDQIALVAEADNQTEDEQAEVDEKPKGRRRGRAAPPLPEPPTSVPTGFGGELSKPRRMRGGKSQQTNHHHAGGEMASSSFYSNASTHPGSRPSTASSDGSSHTAETTESTYSLRDKRKRNFALENDPELEARPQRRGRGAAAQKQDGAEPKKRGPRKKEAAAQPPPPAPAPAPSPYPPPGSPPPLQPPAATNFYHNFVAGPMMVDMGNGSNPALTQAGPFMHTFNAAPAFPPGAPPPPPPPPAVKKPITKIKFTNNGASSQATSRAETPSNGAPNPKPGTKRSRGNKANSSSEAKAIAAANGDGDLDKPYSEMTKSEKMSWSMRRRWASGEMQGAVEKRRTTLAIKKAEKAAGSSVGPDGADSNAMGQMTDSGSAGPSDPTTPASMHGQPGSGLLALPQVPPMMLQPPQPHQGFLQQPPYPYGMPPGPPGPPML